ncbi:MAG: class I SAM-dependent methyltransferase [Hyphomonas sp.]|nr:class I SAM-dependent methyltransferase [Hyphomonas sp.]
MKHLAPISLAALLLSACASSIPDPEPGSPIADSLAAPETAPAPEAAPVPEAPSAKVAAGGFDYESVFAQDDRPEADYELYPVRKSAEVLMFTGVMPGMTVVELEAGDGFYTELLSKVVGEAGTVYMQNPAGFAAFLGDAVPKRVNDRLANVDIVESNFDNLSAIGDGEADIVTWFLGPHELWFTPEGEQAFSFGDPDRTFPEIARVLKPGGSFIVLDHMASPGSPATTGNETHRIDKAIIISMAEAAGFTLAGESDILANPDDDGTVGVFDPTMRRKTDRYLLKFTH